MHLIFRLRAAKEKVYARSKQRFLELSRRRHQSCLSFRFPASLPGVHTLRDGCVVIAYLSALLTTDIYWKFSRATKYFISPAFPDILPA